MSALHVVHTTGFVYADEVTASYNEARLTPARGRGQRVRAAAVEVRAETWSHEYVDYWGTAVTAFEVLDPHRELVVRAESTVEVDERRGVGVAAVSWSDLGGERVLDAHAAFLGDTPTTAVPDEVAALALDAAGGRDPQAAAEAVCLAVREGIEYVPGVTSAHTPARDAWAARQGVCQDMAHLCAGALRSLGIPTRYVSGYLHPREDAELGETVAGESHAWVEWWVGGWFGFDPTNRRAVGRDHVVLGRGREYLDVAPLKGVYAGSGGSELDVTVEVTRLP
ncbi:transglutaminase family protein [Cellulosimicrobium cellulans]|uniref:transglutaminase family protein n=1 Tax=Cellulosimicrobium cellulans TaxID=1710 RepID=UPI001EDB38CD|nr:transglutaminase family protein [Cellulosimicrobium cellulans]UKJ65200.1 transglutaminase family protein [Cellulosimicrobium cellulans]